MSRRDRENQEVNMEAVEAVEATEATEATEVAEKQTYQLDDGSMGSRSAYIRQEFKKDKSRNEIAKELGVAYYIVYSATANMFNAVHTEEGSTTGRSIMIDDPENPGTQIARVEAIKRDFAAGVSRGDIAKKYGVPYGTVYGATKGASEGTGSNRVMITLDDGNTIGRAEYIRQQYAAGKTRREIANELTCDYAVVWAATKEKKEAEATEAEIPTDVEE